MKRQNQFLDQSVLLWGGTEGDGVLDSPLSCRSAVTFSAVRTQSSGFRHSVCQRWHMTCQPAASQWPLLQSFVRMKQALTHTQLLSQALIISSRRLPVVLYLHFSVMKINKIRMQ